MRLEGKTVLITAATRGIGLACVQACAREGAHVYMAARNLPLARELAEGMNAQGGHVHWVFNDATQPESYQSMVAEVVADAGRLDVLVNNFGTSNPREDRDLAGTAAQVFETTVLTNLRSVFLASQQAAQCMAQQGGGSIINMSSVGGSVPDVSQIAYGTSKAAINHLTKLIAVQEAKHGIRCNAVLPGMTATEAVAQHLSEDFRRTFLRHVPLGRVGQPEDIAAAVIYLASDEAAYVTGQLLTVSGGFGLPTPIYGDYQGKLR